MSSPKIFESEYRFCRILWENEPIKSGDLARLCAEQLGWKTTTTYTVIKRLSDRGVIKNEHTVVSSLVSRQEAEAAEIEELIEKKFDSSVPGFLAAFTKSRRLNAKEIAEISAWITEVRKELKKKIYSFLVILVL